MEKARDNDPILNVVKSLLRDDSFMGKPSEEQWDTAKRLLKKEKMNSVETEKKSSL